MLCKCGHLAEEHYIVERLFSGELAIPCVICDCKDYERDLMKEAGF